MGMTTKSGKYFANPAVGRAHERAEAKDGAGARPARPETAHEAPEGDEPAGGAHSVHVFRAESGRHHVVAHHPHGAEVSEHDSLEDAMNHAHRAMKDDGAEDEAGAGAPAGDGYGASSLETTL